MDYQASMLQTGSMSPFLQEHGSIRGEGPSGEERTPGRSEPLDLCSTEDHDHHLQNEAAAKVIISVRFGHEQVKRRILRRSLFFRPWMCP